MKKYLVFILLISSLFSNVYAQTDSIRNYSKKTYMIPMRDGVKLFTVVFAPIQSDKLCPFLIQRTPYGADFPIPEGESIPVSCMSSKQSVLSVREYFRF